MPTEHERWCKECKSTMVLLRSSKEPLEKSRLGIELGKVMVEDTKRGIYKPTLETTLNNLKELELIEKLPDGLWACRDPWRDAHTVIDLLHSKGPFDVSGLKTLIEQKIGHAIYMPTLETTLNNLKELELIEKLPDGFWTCRDPFCNAHHHKQLKDKETSDIRQELAEKVVQEWIVPIVYKKAMWPIFISTGNTMEFIGKEIFKLWLREDPTERRRIYTNNLGLVNMFAQKRYDTLELVLTLVPGDIKRVYASTVVGEKEEIQILENYIKHRVFLSFGRIIYDKIFQEVYFCCEDADELAAHYVPVRTILGLDKHRPTGMGDVVIVVDHSKLLVENSMPHGVITNLEEIKRIDFDNGRKYHLITNIPPLGPEGENARGVLEEFKKRQPSDETKGGLFLDKTLYQWLEDYKK